jgi:cytochrome c-type biogenesis protein
MESILSNISDVINNSPGLAFLFVFLAGLLSASSPCVLAIIPLVIGFVGGYSEGNKKKAVTYAVVFALGLSITFTILGAIASLVGGLFGDVGKFWYYVAGAVAIIMGLYLAGVLRFKLPQPVSLKTKHRGVIGAFLLGLLFGAVSSPCATPVLAVILAFVATKGKIIYGTSLLFVYAVGHCALIVLAGIFTGFVESYAKSKGVSNFSNVTKRISGVLIFLVGLYVLYINI